MGDEVDNDKLKDLFGNIGKFTVPNIEPLNMTPAYEMLDPNRKEYHSPEEILDEDSDEFERPDFSSWKCKICEESIEDGYFWYYLRHDRDESKSVAVCSKECLDKQLKNGNFQNHEIYEYSRCAAYYKCEEIGNLRGICELVENKTYQSIFKLNAVNHCQPAQAGTILSTHKLTETLTNFSKQTEQQYLSNKEMMEQGAKESTKQFRITTWMTVLVIVLTLANLVPAFLNWGGNNYSEQLSDIEIALNELNPSEELGKISNKLDEVTALINSNSTAPNYNEGKIIELLESIQEELKVINGE